MLAMMGRTLNLIRQLMILMATAGRKVADLTWVLMNINPLNKEAYENHEDILIPHKKNKVCDIGLLENASAENGLCSGKDLPQKIKHPTSLTVRLTLQPWLAKSLASQSYCKR